MPPTTGNYSKGIAGGFLEEQRLAFAVLQKGVPFIDADFNRSQFINYLLIRRALGVLIGDASPNNGFKIVADGSSNDFIVSGGDGTLSGAGRMWVNGNQAMLLSDIRFVNLGATDDGKSIFPSISFILGISNEILQDTSANYTPGALVGRTITPDVTTPATTATILANTATDLTLDIDLGASGVVVGDRYRIELSTPSGADRNDGIYLDTYLDEVDGAELPDIRHDFGTFITAAHFLQVRQRILVVEGDSVGNPGGLTPLLYVDADGFSHSITKLADVARFDGQAAINVPDVTDLRATAGNFTNFLNKTGDNMSGDLNMLPGTDIILAALGLVDGRDVSVDGAKLDLIDFTSQGIANKLPLSTFPVQGTTLTAVATAAIPVSEFLRDKEPGGTTTVKGIFTTAPDNKTLIQDADTADAIVGGTSGSEGVFGLLTENHPVPNISGTWTFTNATFAVTGVGGAANTQLLDGDIVRGPDGLFYTVDGTPGSANAFTIKEPFAGTTGPTVTPDARRWILTLRLTDPITEVDFTPSVPVDISWHYEQSFDEADRPVRTPLFAITSDQQAAEVPDASETIKGKALHAADLELSATKVPTADDSRLLGGSASKDPAVPINADRGPIRLIEGGAIGITHSFIGGEHIFTISSTVGAGLTLDTVTTPRANLGSGAANPTGSIQAAPADHEHPFDTGILFSSDAESSPLDIVGTIVADGTIPQITEGFEILSTIITPANSTYILIAFVATVLRTTAAGTASCLFRSDQTDALAVAMYDPWEGTTASTIPILWVGAANTASPLTLSVRIGTHDGTTIGLNQLRDGAGGIDNDFGASGTTSLVVIQLPFPLV